MNFRPHQSEPNYEIDKGQISDKIITWLPASYMY